MAGVAIVNAVALGGDAAADIIPRCGVKVMVVARRRGWDGDPPTSDDDASRRIVAKAVELMAASGSDISIAEVAESLGVTRQTVYRYFPSAEELMQAASVASVDGFLDRLTDAVRGITDPAEAITQAVLYSLEEVTRTPHLGILLTEPYRGAHSPGLASDQAQEFAMQLVTRFDVDWEQYGYDRAALREMVEFALRVMLSFFVAPNDSGRNSADLRRFIHRWLGGAIVSQRNHARSAPLQ